MNWKKAGIAAGVSAGVFLGMKYVFPVILPFFLGWILAEAVHVPAKRICEKQKMCIRDRCCPENERPFESGCPWYHRI